MLMQFFDAVAVGVHVVFVDVGYDGHNRREVQEGGVGLVGLGDDVFAFAQAGVGTGGGEFAADNEGGVEAGGGEDGGGEAGGGGFAVRTGDGDAVFEAHEFGQHQGAGDDGYLLREGGGHFGVVFFDGGGGYDDIRAADVFGGVAGVDAHAQGGQVLSYRALRLVGSGDDVALVVQHFGDAAHARAADADEMDVSDSVFHGGVLILRFQTASAAHQAV